jgi:hypothetical protein
MRLLPNQKFGDAAEILIELIIKSQAIDPKTNFIDFDNIWVDPEHRKQLTSVIEMSLSCLLPDSFTPLKTVLVSPDNLRRPFGILPAVACVAQRLGTYMAVWKEAADFSTGLGKLYGPTGISLNGYILQDVVATGGTVLKMASALKKTAWRIEAHMCLVRARPLSGRIDHNLEELRAVLHSTPDPIPSYYVVHLSSKE